MPEEAEEQVQTIPAGDGSAEQPQDTGTGPQARSASLLALSAEDSNGQDDPVEQPAAGDDPGEDGSAEGAEAEPSGDEDSPGEEPGTSEGEEEPGGEEPAADDDGLVEVEVYGVKQKVTPERAELIRKGQELADRERELLEKELKWRRKQAGKAEHEAKQLEKQSDPEPEGPPPVDRKAMVETASKALEAYERDGKPESLYETVKAFLPALVEDAGLVHAVGDHERLARGYLDLAKKVEQLEQGIAQTSQELAPQIERKQAVEFARTDLGFADAPKETLEKAYDSARPEWTEEIEAIGLDPESEQARVMRGRIYRRHVQAALDAAKSETPAKPSSPPRNTNPKKRAPVTTGKTPASPRQPAPESQFMRRGASLSQLVEAGH